MMSTLELIKLSQNGDEQAKEMLIIENTGLIWSVVRRFVGRGTETDDLYQLGCLGFLKAVDGFDPLFGTKFSTYAVPKISGEIRRFLRDDGALKVSRSVKEQAALILGAKNKLMSDLSREPTLGELSEETGISVEEIAYAISATAATESIQRECGEEGFSLEDVLTDSDSEEDMVEKISLMQAIERLSDREKNVIKLRYFHGLTQERVSKILSVSQVQISRIENRIIKEFREKLIG